MQYSKAFTDALQFMWGEGFLSPGGPEEVARMLEGMDLAGLRVLDIGSGLGGVDALLVARHGAGAVVGIDVEAPLIEQAKALIAARGLSDRVSFSLVDPGSLPFADCSFDMVFSKDAMVHIADKETLYRDVWRVLKHGGWFVAADWLWAKGAATSPVVRDWLAGGPLTFAFTTPEEANEDLVGAGFIQISIVDRRQSLRLANAVEVESLESKSFERLARIVGDAMARQRLHSARGRQAALETGDLIPSHLRARKPA